MRTAIAVVLTALVTIPVTTLAQPDTPCAWVAWIKWRSNPYPAAEQWEIRDAVATRTECLELNRRLWRVTREQSTGPFVVSVDGVEGVLLTIKYESGWMTMEYMCLPSSLDPRPR